MQDKREPDSYEKLRCSRRLRRFNNDIERGLAADRRELEESQRTGKPLPPDNIFVILEQSRRNREKRELAAKQDQTDVIIHEKTQGLDEKGRTYGEMLVSPKLVERMRKRQRETE